MSPLVGALTLLLAAAAPSDRIQERAREVLGQRGYQTRIPVEPPPETWHWPWSLPTEPLALILRALLYVALVVVVSLAVFWLMGKLRPGLRNVEAPAETAADSSGAVFETGTAEALAAAGRYADAIHALLLDTLVALSSAARLGLSLTSREIVAGAPMSPRAREALRALVQVVEITHFGGAEPTADDYQACRERFQVFLDSYRSPA